MRGNVAECENELTKIEQKRERKVVSEPQWEAPRS